jgi:hypothetical protein
VTGITLLETHIEYIDTQAIWKRIVGEGTVSKQISLPAFIGLLNVSAEIFNSIVWPAAARSCSSFMQRSEPALSPKRIQQLVGGDSAPRGNCLKSRLGLPSRHGQLLAYADRSHIGPGPDLHQSHVEMAYRSLNLLQLECFEGMVNK